MSKILYEKYIQETGEIISEFEWLLMEKRYSGKMREFESWWEKSLKYGLVGASTAYITSKAYGAVGTVVAGPHGTALGIFGAILMTPIALIAYSGYRKNSDKCRKLCNENQQCYYTCYYNACEDVVRSIAKSIVDVRRRKDDGTGKKAKALKKLNNELEKWVKRQRKYKKKLDQMKMKK